MMITESKPNGEWRVPGVELSKLDMRLYGALYKLHRYEMLGYEPEQIEDFDHLYREKCNEVTRLRLELENLQKTIESASAAVKSEPAAADE
nr:MAG TPA: hypothetical protein [Caudoviricetes sp.]